MRFLTPRALTCISIRQPYSGVFAVLYSLCTSLSHTLWESKKRRNEKIGPKDLVKYLRPNRPRIKIKNHGPRLKIKRLKSKGKKKEKKAKKEDKY